MAKTDFQSFDRLYAHYFPKMFGFVKSKVLDEQKTEDLVSEIFMKVMENLDKFEWKDVPFGAWIFKIARNHLYDHYHKENREGYKESIDDRHDISDKGKYSNPHKTAHLNEVQKIVINEMEKLTQKEKEVVEMKFFGDMKNKEIADALNYSERNVGVILFRTLRKLKGPLSQLNL